MAETLYTFPSITWDKDVFLRSQMQKGQKTKHICNYSWDKWLQSDSIVQDDTPVFPSTSMIF